MELFGRAGDGNAVYLGTRQRARSVASLVDLVEFSGNDHGWRYCCLLLSLVDLAGCRRQIWMKKRAYISMFVRGINFFQVFVVERVLNCLPRSRRHPSRSCQCGPMHATSCRYVGTTDVAQSNASFQPIIK